MMASPYLDVVKMDSVTLVRHWCTVTLVYRDVGVVGQRHICAYDVFTVENISTTKVAPSN